MGREKEGKKVVGILLVVGKVKCAAYALFVGLTVKREN